MTQGNNNKHQDNAKGGNYGGIHTPGKTSYCFKLFVSVNMLKNRWSKWKVDCFETFFHLLGFFYASMWKVSVLWLKYQSCISTWNPLYIYIYIYIYVYIYIYCCCWTCNKKVNVSKWISPQEFWLSVILGFVSSNHRHKIQMLHDYRGLDVRNMCSIGTWNNT